MFTFDPPLTIVFVRFFLMICICTTNSFFSMFIVNNIGWMTCFPYGGGSIIMFKFVLSGLLFWLSPGVFVNFKLIHSFSKCHNQTHIQINTMITGSYFITRATKQVVNTFRHQHIRMPNVCGLEGKNHGEKAAWIYYPNPTSQNDRSLTIWRRHQTTRDINLQVHLQAPTYKGHQFLAPRSEHQVNKWNTNPTGIQKIWIADLQIEYIACFWFEKPSRHSPTLHMIFWWNYTMICMQLT